MGLKFMCTLLTIFQEFFGLPLFPCGTGFLFEPFTGSCMCAFPFIIWLPNALLWPMKGKGQMRWIKGAGEGHFHISCGMGLAPGCNLYKWLLIKGLFSVTSTENRGQYSCYMILFFLLKIVLFEAFFMTTLSCQILAKSVCSLLWHLGKNQ